MSEPQTRERRRSQRSIFRAQAIASMLGDSEKGTPDILVRPPWLRLLIGGCLLGMAFWLWP